jgi:glycine cleavage system H protein
MYHCPEELMYTVTHEWALTDEDSNIVTIGITDFAQDKLGEISHVDLPEVGLKIVAGDEVCSLESVKTQTEVFSPLSGKIVAVNEDLEEAPGLINSDPYQDGWLYKIDLKDQAEYDELFDVNAYKEHLSEIEED